jgi:hypothetical protein
VDAGRAVWSDRLLFLETLRHSPVLEWAVALLALWLSRQLLPETMPGAAAARQFRLRRLLPQGTAALSAASELRGLRRLLPETELHLDRDRQRAGVSVR